MLTTEHAEPFERRLLEVVSDIEDPMADVLRDALHGGKRMRPALCQAWYAACGGDDDEWLRPAVAVELLHRASLVHDDLPCMDNDPTRNGRPSMHCAHGHAAALLAGDVLIAAAFAEVAGMPAGSLASRIMLQTVTAMAAGQCREHESKRPPSLRAWLGIADGKTGALIVAASRLGSLAAGRETASASATRFGLLLGRVYQLRDDLTDADPLPHRAAELIEPTVVSLRDIADGLRRPAALHDFLDTALAAHEARLAG